MGLPPFLHALHLALSSIIGQILCFTCPLPLAGEFARTPARGSAAVVLAALVSMIGGEAPATVAAFVSLEI
jgi:hypothetical protein